MKRTNVEQRKYLQKRLEATRFCNWSTTKTFRIEGLYERLRRSEAESRKIRDLINKAEQKQRAEKDAAADYLADKRRQAEVVILSGTFEDALAKVEAYEASVKLENAKWE